MAFKTPVETSKVWYQTNQAAPNGPQGGIAVNGRDFLAAFVSRVHSPRLVDLVVTDVEDKPHKVPFVTLVQPGDPDPDALVGHCRWTKPEAPAARESQSIGAADVGRVEDVLGIGGRKKK